MIPLMVNGVKNTPFIGYKLIINGDYFVQRGDVMIEITSSNFFELLHLCSLSKLKILNKCSFIESNQGLKLVPIASEEYKDEIKNHRISIKDIAIGQKIEFSDYSKGEIIYLGTSFYAYRNYTPKKVYLFLKDHTLFLSWNSYPHIYHAHDYIDERFTNENSNINLYKVENIILDSLRNKGRELLLRKENIFIGDIESEEYKGFKTGFDFSSESFLTQDEIDALLDFSDDRRF